MPNGTTRLTAHAEWSPPQQMGLEFHAPGHTTPTSTSWNDTDAASVLQLLPPIDMTLDSPEPGKWWIYLGPGVVGAGVSWNMTLTMETILTGADGL